MWSFDNEQRLRLLQVSCMLFFMHSTSVKLMDKGRGVEVEDDKHQAPFFA